MSISVKRAVFASAFLSLLAVSGLQGQNLAAGAPTILAQPSAPSIAAPPRLPQTYGTTYTSFYRVSSTEFSPANTDTTYSDLSQVGLIYARYPTANAGSAFVASPHLPSGASITSVELDACDTNATDDVIMNLVSTSWDGTGATLITSVSSSGSGGCGGFSASLTTPFTVDNNNNQFVLVVFVPDIDGSTGIAGAIIHYVLQVSPAPMTPTFGDVPTTDPGFQYIEALVSSGITAGCGGGNYCPDATLTRRQMAVFLAKALGLQWE